MTALTKGFLEQSIRDLFSPAQKAVSSMAIGAELELIPVLAHSGARLLATEGDPSGDSLLREIAEELGWTEEPVDKGPSGWRFETGRISFEPGGQIELSSSVFSSASELLESMESWLAVFARHGEAKNVRFRAVGIEESVHADSIPLQLHGERYARMTRYFETIGPFGVIMMRQTASLQVNVEKGPDPVARWRLLNALTPYLVSIFANSPLYGGKSTGHKSYRAHVWRMLDEKRTGLPWGPDPAEAYMEFALNAPVILGPPEIGFLSFTDLLSLGVATEEMWETHLTTLFPEIRPREYFEIRSLDAVPANYIAAAIVFVCGIVYSEESSDTAATMIGIPDIELLATAGREGLSNTSLRRTAIDLVHLSLRGCESLGQQYIITRDLDRARLFFNRYTFRGRAPGDDQPRLP